MKPVYFSPSADQSRTPLVIITGSLKLGGTTTFLFNLGRQFRKMGLELPVISLSDDNEMPEDQRESGINLTCIDSRKLIYEDRLAAAYRAVSQYAPKLVIAALGHSSFEFLRIVPSGVQRLAMIQTDEPGVYEALSSYIPWLDHVVGVSSQIVTELDHRAEFTAIPKTAIPYGIDFSQDSDDSSRQDDGPIQLVYVGRLIEEQKRVSRLMELARGLQMRGIAFEFHLIGSGPEENFFSTEEAVACGFHVYGQIPNHELATFLRKAHLFILLSDYEGLPLALLEAMGEGVVPIVSDLPSGIGEVVDEKCGITVPIGDIEAAVSAVLTLSQNRELLRALSAQAKERARTCFSSLIMAQKYIDLLKQSESCHWPTEVPEIEIPVGLRNKPAFGKPLRSLRRWLKSLSAPQ